MHLLVRETRSLDDDAPAQDLDQAPAPLVMLSFSDADLAGVAAAHRPDHPELRLASLGRLRHPLSVDLYLEKTVAHAACVVIRLLGGVEWWRYGVEETAALCRANGIALALLPGDACDDTRLRALSTVPPETWAALDTCFRAGGPAHMAQALAWATHAAQLGPKPQPPPPPLAQHAVHALDLAFPSGGPEANLAAPPLAAPPLAAIVFYRSHLLSADIAPIEALIRALRDRGLAVGALYVASLKPPETAAWVARTLAAWRPAVILNATAFSARATAPDGNDLASPLDAPGVPVLQLVLSGSREPAWAASSRGLAPADLAMHVVLPELDGRLGTEIVSFKADAAPDPALQWARTHHAPHAPGIAAAADRAAAWTRLATTPRADRRLAIILSDYPGIAGQRGHAVGLDSFASLAAILDDLGHAGWTTRTETPAHLTDALCTAPPTAILPLPEYRRLLATLPAATQAALHDAWGDPQDDPAVHDGQFTLRHLHLGHATLALQPDRGAVLDRRAGYHDPTTPPRHAYVAFHLWLRHTLDVHALLHLGTHGSLEWLPGKAAALAPDCWPRILAGAVPVIYPFIVNNPGEAAPAKRRLAAVTIGHLTPPIGRTEIQGPLRTLERLIDEFAAADGMDRRRTAALRTEILEHARATGLLLEAGTPRDADPDAALAHLDAYLCDVKDLLLRDGLHVFGRAPPGNRTAAGPGTATNPGALQASPAAEAAALLAALDGRFVPPGPAGAPTRGRTDVLPTGRNLTTIDPRAIPTRSAITLAERAAAALLRRHLAEHGEYPRSLVLDLWGSATMRTGGEDLALAMILLGARPTWDDGSARVSGFEILPLALLDRPRIDVTLRISGLFRDAFPAQLALFDALVHALAARDEAADWNPLAGHPATRIYGPQGGQYGAGDGSGEGWLRASAGAYGRTADGAPDPAGLAARVAAADALVHVQDHAEHDLLDSPEWAAHEGGFAQAAASLGARPALWHLDTSTPEAPRPRALAEEVRRIVRGRAANPAWIRGQMRHAYRGAAEIARPLAALQAFAQTLPTRFDAQFDLLHAATLADPEVDAFLQAENPDARADMAARFAAVQKAGLWHPRRNAAP